MNVRSLLERAVGAVERWQVVDAAGYQVEHAVALTQSHALGKDRLAELGDQLQARQRELADSGGMRLVVRLERGTLRLV